MPRLAHMPPVTALALGATLAAASLPAQADLVILQYHHISDRTPPSTSTSVSLFKAQLAMIDRQGLPVVPLESGTRQALGQTDGKDPERQAVAITFDDAYDSIVTTAAPLLADRGYPFTVFVNPEMVGHHGFMTWEQLGRLADTPGVTIANHSADHGHLARGLDETETHWRERVAQSLDQAQHELTERLGSAPPLFAYPYGEFDEGLEALIRERGWLAYGQQSGPVGRQTDPNRLPRFPMANAYGQLDSLRDKLNTLAFPVDTGALPDGIVSDNPPSLNLTLPEGWSTDRLTCFGSGVGRIPVEPGANGSVTVSATEPFKSRRFRYNCTYPAGGGQFYWLSQPWLDLSRPED
ncbi:polysaccharide deacetylase family protein [Marinobacter sp. C2H3]|uniref:polysaccharide deacetylase family protein n=1 Tax=Marinobacter sp. C2H3 TaxID=3119003 RepID=UPI003FA54B94